MVTDAEVAREAVKNTCDDGGKTLFEKAVKWAKEEIQYSGIEDRRSQAERAERPEGRDNYLFISGRRSHYE